MARTKIDLQVEPELRAALEKLAVADMRKLGPYVRKVLQEHVRKRRPRPRKSTSTPSP